MVGLAKARPNYSCIFSCHERTDRQTDRKTDRQAARTSRLCGACSGSPQLCLRRAFQVGKLENCVTRE